MADRISAAEAAARLGVKRETIYAYVSRGLLDSERAIDGKTSTFDPDEIAALRSGRRKRVRGELGAIFASAITQVDDAGLSYRGRDVEVFVDTEASFEHVAWWLWTGTALEPERWIIDRSTIDAVEEAIARLDPHILTLDRLRIGTAIASSMDPLRHDSTGTVRVGPTLLAALVASLAVRGDRVPFERRIADHLWSRLSPQRHQDATTRAMNAALVLLADHDLAPSTFAARIAASTRADPYSVVSAGLGALGGVLHGAASGLVHELFVDAERRGSASATVAAHLHRDGRLPGFGHVVYRRRDPRFELLSGLVRSAFRRDPRLAIVLDVHELASQQLDAIPNVDFALGAFTFLAEMTPDAGEAIFAVARTAGWLAHAIEELDQPPLRFRPRSRRL